MKNWTKALGVLGLVFSGAAMLVDKITQKQEIAEAATKAAEKAVKEILKKK